MLKILCQKVLPREIEHPKIDGGYILDQGMSIRFEISMAWIWSKALEAIGSTHWREICGKICGFDDLHTGVTCITWIITDPSWHSEMWWNYGYKSQLIGRWTHGSLKLDVQVTLWDYWNALGNRNDVWIIIGILRRKIWKKMEYKIQGWVVSICEEREYDRLIYSVLKIIKEEGIKIK